MKFPKLSTEMYEGNNSTLPYISRDIKQKWKVD